MQKLRKKIKAKKLKLKMEKLNLLYGGDQQKIEEYLAKAGEGNEKEEGKGEEDGRPMEFQF